MFESVTNIHMRPIKQTDRKTDIKKSEATKSIQTDFDWAEILDTSLQVNF